MPTATSISAAPSFPLALRFRISLYTVALLGVTAFAHTDGNYTPLVLGAVVACMAWLLFDSSLIRAPAAWLAGLLPAAPDAPGWWGRAIRWLAPHTFKILFNLIVLAAAVYFWHEVVQLGEPGNRGVIIALAHFIVVLLLCKFLERKTLRNIVQILVLSLLLIVSATMFSSSGLVFFLILAAYVAALFYAVVLLNLLQETERLSRAASVPVVIPSSETARGAARKSGPLGLLRRDLRDTVKQCFFLVSPVAIALFLLVPRSRGNSSLGPWGLGAYQTGYSDTVQFRDYGQLQPSDTPVMTVRLFRGNEDVSSEFSDLYFRGQVLNQYSDRGVWSHGPSALPSASASSSPDTAPLPEDPVSESSAVRVTYDLKLPSGRTLFVLAPCVPPAGADYSYSPDDMTCRYNQSRAGGSGDLKYSLGWNKELATLARGDPFCSPGELTPAFPPRVIEGAVVERPAVMVSPQIDELAHRLITDLVPAEQRIQSDQIRSVMTIFENYLRANYPYSMTFRRVDPKLEPTTDFLLNRKATGGHCEYFASAMVMMCRAVGLNARMVTGYYGGEYVKPLVGNGYFEIQQKHAHAWAEVYIPGQGWILSDPSPGNANLDASALAGNWFHDLTRLVQGTWLTAVVSFDNDTRAALARWLTAKFDTLLDLQPFSLALTALLWGALLALVVVLVVLHRRFRRLRPLLAGTQGIPHRQMRLSAHVGFLDDLLHLFDPAGTRRPDLTPLEFLQPHFLRLAPAAAEKTRWLVVTAYGVRFGGLLVDADLKHDIALALRSVKSAVRSRPPGTPLS
jgi:protein-glutamine gamma-glutamyltransferase